MTSLPDLYVASPISDTLLAGLATRFTVHRDDPPATTRAIAGGGMTKVDQSLLDRLPALEIIAIHGVGHDRIDLPAVRARGIRVTTTPVLTDDVADLAVALIYAVLRNLAANDRAARDGTWHVPLSHRVTGRRIGIFGLGRIGMAIAERVAPFAGEVLYTARAEKPDVAWRYQPDITALAEASDVLILAAPGGTATDRIVDAQVLQRLGRDGVLVNIARGSLVDQDALVAALAAGAIAGAGLDVFTDEPAIPDALKTMPQVVLSQHQGSATAECRAEMAQLVLDNLDAHFSGRPLPTPLD